MISSVFIHRPRLAFVISIVITIAGLISYYALPVAQFPDIVPPQVQVSGVYPGVDAAAVEASVAQTIEPAVNGVDKMIYMKSTSGADGTYNLSVSFAVGTNVSSAFALIGSFGRSASAGKTRRSLPSILGKSASVIFASSFFRCLWKKPKIARRRSGR